MRKPGHKLAYLRSRLPWGWAWQCECGFRTPYYAGTKAIAVNEHRDHKARLGTPDEHATIVTHRTRAGTVSTCACGAALGSCLSLDEAARAHRVHLVQQTESSEPQTPAGVSIAGPTTTATTPAGPLSTEPCDVCGRRHPGPGTPGVCDR